MDVLRVMIEPVVDVRQHEQRLLPHGLEHTAVEQRGLEG